MPPRQPYQSHPQPQQPMPQQPPASTLPQYGYDAVPGHSQRPQHFVQHPQQHQQHPSGHYEVVPTPQPSPNDGHSGHNPYDFIVNPNNSTKRVSLTANLTGGSFFMRIGLVVGGFVVILIVAGVLISALAPKGSVPGLTSIAQRQQEIARVATEAEQQTVSQDAMNFVANVQVSISSSQQQVLDYLTAHGTELGDKTLALDDNPQTDTRLSNAATANNYDSAVTQYMITQLQNYQGLLQTTYQQTNSTGARSMLQSDFNGTNLLLKQAKALQNELNN